MINRVPDTRAAILKGKEGGSPEGSTKSESTQKQGPDWTYNKPKAEQLTEVIEKELKTLDQIVKIFQSNLEFSKANEKRIKDILAKQDQETLKVYLFRRLLRVYFSDQICLEELINKLNLLMQLSQFLFAEMTWLNLTFYKDEEVDKMISIETKQAIFNFMQLVKSTEVSIRVLTMQAVCSHLFRQFQTVQLLFTDKYPSFHTYATIQDVHSWQTSIRKGSRRIGDEEMAALQKTPNSTKTDGKLIGSNDKLGDAQVFEAKQVTTPAKTKVESLNTSSPQKSQRYDMHKADKFQATKV